MYPYHFNDSFAMGDLNPLNIEKRDVIHQTETEDNFVVGHPNVVSLSVRNAYRTHTLPPVTMEVGIPIAVSMYKRNLFNYEIGPVESFNLNVPIAVSANRVNKLKKLSTYPLDEVLLLSSPVAMSIWSTCAPVLAAPRYLHVGIVDDNIRIAWFNSSITLSSQNIYISTTPFIDGEALPTPISVSNSARFYDITEYPITQESLYIIVSTVAAAEILSEPYTYSSAVDDNGDPYWGNVTSLLHFNGDLMDAKTGAYWVNNSNVAITTTALLLTGRFNQKITANYSIFNVLGLDFTVEFFLTFNAQFPPVFIVCEETSRNFSIAFSIAGGVYIATRDSSGIQHWVSTGGVLPPIGQRVHFAFTRKDGFVRIFYDGVLKGSGPLIAQRPLDPRVNSIIGSPYSMYPSVNGALEEFRATIGVARYTENFTPPTGPFPNGS